MAEKQPITVKETFRAYCFVFLLCHTFLYLLKSLGNISSSHSQVWGISKQTLSLTNAVLPLVVDTCHYNVSKIGHMVWPGM